MLAQASAELLEENRLGRRGAQEDDYVCFRDVDPFIKHIYLQYCCDLSASKILDSRPAVAAGHLRMDQHCLRH